MLNTNLKNFWRHLKAISSQCLELVKLITNNKFKSPQVNMIIHGGLRQEISKLKTLRVNLNSCNQVGTTL